MNEINIEAMQTQINNVKNELRNEMKTLIQASMSNQTNELKNMMASFFQMNTASTSGLGPLPSNTIANPKGELKAITTRSEETLMDPDLAEYTTKVPPFLVQKVKPPSQRNYVVHQRDPLHPNIPYPLRMHKQKQQDKDEIQIHKFWQMFKQLHLNITLVDALILIPNELKCKALADLGASINLMPLSVWKTLGLPELISTRMTLELANRAICTLAEIARDVFVLVGKFTFPADFVIVDYESDPRVSLILGRPFLRTARALTDVHGEEMILRNGDKRLTLNMRHDTSSYSNQPQKESINMINIFDDSCEDYLKDLFATNHLSGNLTFSSHPDLTSPKVINPLSESKLLIDELDLPRSSDFLPSSEYDSFLFEDFFEVDALPSTDNEDKVFNLGILIQENLSEDTVQATPDKNVKKIAISHASLILEDFDPPLYELPFHKEVLGSETLLSFSSENE
nr:hypothetical protein [Tanacetum cinerariifolium]